MANLDRVCIVYFAIVLTYGEPEVLIYSLADGRIQPIALKPVSEIFA